MWCRAPDRADRPGCRVTAPQVSDRALLRFLERAGGVDVERLRRSLASSLERSHDAALRMGGGDHLIAAGASVFVVRDGIVVTVARRGPPGSQARTLAGPSHD